MKLSTTAAIRSHSSQPAEGVDMRLLEQLFDHTPDTAFFIKDAAGYYLAVNHSLLGRHGLRDKSQMLGRRPCNICPGDFGCIPAEQDASVLRTGRPIIKRLELQWYLPHKPVWCLTTKLPMRGATGAVTGIIGISKDVRAPVAPPRTSPRRRGCPRPARDRLCRAAHASRTRQDGEPFVRATGPEDQAHLRSDPHPAYC